MINRIISNKVYIGVLDFKEKQQSLIISPKGNRCLGSGRLG